ncbi:MAG: 50S ribosomal protein L6, partial [archaeon]|nr:50S ribosomal protein L6 [archaeon]
MEMIQKIVIIPENMKAELSGKKIKIASGSNISEKVLKAKEIIIEIKGNEIILTTTKRKKNNAMLTTFTTHIQNLIDGLQKPFEYRLSIVYSHFPMNVAVKGNFVEINNFAGEKKPRKAKILGKTKVEVKGKDLIVTGHVKDDVSQTA